MFILKYQNLTPNKVNNTQNLLSGYVSSSTVLISRKYNFHDDERGTVCTPAAGGKRKNSANFILPLHNV
jgi:hypothetical protein